MAQQRWQYVLIFLSYISIALAASPTTFCKCTCFSNSTIIPFDNTFQDKNSTSEPHSPRVCNDCTKQFCLSQSLPICDEATEDEVVTLCFQRDSTKDELVIFIFIFATVGLLAWAAVKPYLLRWRESRRGYAPVGGQ